MPLKGVSSNQSSMPGGLIGNQSVKKNVSVAVREMRRTGGSAVDQQRTANSGTIDERWFSVKVRIGPKRHKNRLIKPLTIAAKFSWARARAVGRQFLYMRQPIGRYFARKLGFAKTPTAYERLSAARHARMAERQHDKLIAETVETLVKDAQHGHVNSNDIREEFIKRLTNIYNLPGIKDYFDALNDQSKLSFLNSLYKRTQQTWEACAKAAESEIYSHVVDPDEFVSSTYLAVSGSLQFRPETNVCVNHAFDACFNARKDRLGKFYLCGNEKRSPLDLWN